MFCRPIRSDEVRAWIAPATIACQHIRSAFFDRAILAVPIALRDHRAPRSLVGLCRVWPKDRNSKSNDSGQNYAPCCDGDSAGNSETSWGRLIAEIKGRPLALGSNDETAPTHPSLCWFGGSASCQCVCVCTRTFLICKCGANAAGRRGKAAIHRGARPQAVLRQGILPGSRQRGLQ